MKRILIAFITVFSMCCLVACGSETTNDVATDNNNEVVVNIDDEPTAKPVVEATAEPTEEPTEEPSSEVVDATTEPTEAPVLYPGIDMNSDLPGAEWIDTFAGIIEEPKVVVYSDTTGRKEIVEEDAMILINPDEDIIAVYLPDGYVLADRSAGIKTKEITFSKYSASFLLDPERTRENKYEMATIFVLRNGEEIDMWFTIESQ